MSAHEHQQSALKSVRVSVLTVSDTRTEADDTSGDHIRKVLTGAGHIVVEHAICRDEPTDVQALVLKWLSTGSQIVITSGGTGITRRDTTYEALDKLIIKRLDGFGELFRMLSFEEVGAAAMMSRATAGTVKGGGVVLALPGSLNAVRLAMERLVLPELGHLAKLASS